MERKRPVIGVVARPFVTEEFSDILGIANDMRNCIIQAGGIPISIMPTKNMVYANEREPQLSEEDKEILDAQISLCDGILMPGGCKIYNYDRYICEVANNKDMPLLGICMGMQTMYIYNNIKKNIKVEGHYISDDSIYLHNVEIDKESKLYEILKKDRLEVNSYHNYALPESGDYTISARSR